MKAASFYFLLKLFTASFFFFFEDRVLYDQTVTSEYVLRVNSSRADGWPGPASVLYFRLVLPSDNIMSTST